MWIRMSTCLKQFYKPSTWNCRYCASVSKEADLDPAPLFFNRDVQQLLITLTRVDYQRAFRIRKDGKPISNPKFKFMTDEELEKAELLAKKKLAQVLQMPPVVKAQPDVVKVISKDPALQGYCSTKYVFTDISYGISNKERLITVRDPDGTLRHASRNERHRMNQAYFPMEGREFHIPKMFYDPYFKDLLDRKEFEFILDRACIQFEPDDPEYQKITKEVYLHVDMGGYFDKLRSTRHFGPLAFYLAWENKIDNLLLDLIRSKNINEAVSLIQLYHKIHPKAKSAEKQKEDDLSFIKCYAKLDSQQCKYIEDALAMYQKLQEEKEKMEKNIRKAHGLDVDDMTSQK
ncbi:mitochondrial ribosomal protein S22 [Calliopsis andreniformis]|uniref:mitochondrial ribosomal protein S22 n=1 Tax=Calliopsis andreniformis TaxID=337506 RepID=UPI003FCEDCF9